MDPATLAAAALTAVAPYLLGLGKIAAEEGAKGAGKSVFDWIKSRLTSAAGKEAVEKFEKAPDARGPKLAFEGQLITWLEENPDARPALEKLLASAAAVSGGQTANVTGSNVKLGQADRGSSVTIR
jgi:hypothetical protein